MSDITREFFEILNDMGDALKASENPKEIVDSQIDAAIVRLCVAVNGRRRSTKETELDLFDDASGPHQSDLIHDRIGGPAHA